MNIATMLWWTSFSPGNFPIWAIAVTFIAIPMLAVGGAFIVGQIFPSLNKG